MKKLVSMAVVCAFVSTAALAMVQQPQQRQTKTPQQDQQSTYFPQQHNQSTYPEGNPQNNTSLRDRKTPVMSQDNPFQTVRSDTTHPKKKDTSTVDTTKKADTSAVERSFKL